MPLKIHKATKELMTEEQKKFDLAISKRVREEGVRELHSFRV